MKIILTILAGAIMLPAFSSSRSGLANDVGIMNAVYAPSKAKMPKRIFTPEIIKNLKAGRLNDAKHFFSYINSSQSRKLTTVPDVQWNKIISDKAPLTMLYSKGRCPFCGKAFDGVETDILKNPLQGKTKCCGHDVFAQESEMPAGYNAIPNFTLKIPHLDGKTVNYRFYIPEGSRKNKCNWFSSEGEIAWTNLIQVLYEVIPALEGRVLLNNDKKAAHTLAVIFARLADVYPGWPYYNPRKPVGIATCADLIPGSGIEDYLLPEVWTKVLEKRRKNFVMFSDWDTKGYSKLPYAWGYGTDGNLKPAGNLAEAWDLICRMPETEKVSQGKYGSSKKLDELIRNKVIDAESLLFSYKKPTLINMMAPYINNGLKVAIVAQDKNFFNKINAIYDGFIFNHHFEDGVSTEGSFNYSAMMGFYLGSPWIYKNYLGIDFRNKYSAAKRIWELGDYPIKTLYNVESMHGDEHAAFFASRHHAPPAKPDYSKHEKSRNFPFYGVTCLRSGKPGARLEAILDYQNQIMHAHNGRMNLQLFFEGINLLPDVGYCKGNANMAQSPWKSMKTGLKPAMKPENLAHTLEGHCTGAIDGSQWDKWTFVPRGYVGTADSFVQYLDVDGKFTYSSHPHKVSAFERKLVTVTFRNGRSCLVDIFRMRGGKRHDMFWHVSGKRVNSNVGSKVGGAGNVYDWYVANCDPSPTWRRNDEYIYKRYFNWKHPSYRQETRQLKNPQVTNPGEQFWTTEWYIDPENYMPKTLARDFYSAWRKVLHPVKLRMWGIGTGNSARNSLISAKGQWASNIMKNKYNGNVVGLKDGFDYLFFNRQAGKPGLDTTFVHVLEPFLPNQKATLKNVKLIQSNRSGILLKLESNTGENIRIGTVFENVDFRAPGISFNGQLAAWSDKGDVTLYGGSYLKAKGISLETAPSWKVELHNVVGDITGQPRESALIVKSSRPLPVGNILSGMTVFVKHQTSPAHVSSYEIEKVSTAGKDLYRIDLKHKPPFIQNKFYVTKYDKRNPGVFKVNMRIFTGVERPNGLNRRVRFPKSGFESSVKHHLVNGYAGWWTRTITLKDKPAKGKIKVGDPVIIYSVGKGDTVEVPSLFCKKGNGVYSTGKEYKFSAGKKLR
jgi:hypothetical protein